MGQRLYLALKLRRAEYHDMITHTIAKSHCTCETVGTRADPTHICMPVVSGYTVSSPLSSSMSGCGVVSAPRSARHG